ncbi:MAG: HAMP domain-containing protein [Planctomycetes bacterium]|nr:HAMP domain-containing protein [Planctomycetota bacterium]
MFKPTKSKLSIFFLIFTFLPLLVMRLVVYPITFQALQGEIIKNLEGAVHKQAELLSKWIEERVADAQHMANNPIVLLMLQPGPENAVHTELTQHLDALKYFDYLWKDCGTQEVFIADRSGMVRVASNKELVGMDVSTKDFFRSAVNGALFTSSIIPSDVPLKNESGVTEAGLPTMLVSAPVRGGDGTVAGVVTHRIDVSRINAMMQDIHIGKTGETYLVNGYGSMLTESRFTDDLKKQQRVKNRSALELKVADAGRGDITKGVRECLKGASGFDANGYLDYRGVNVLGFWRWMPDYGWGIIAEIDVEEGYGTLYQLRNYIMFVFGMVAVGVIIIAFFLGKKISAPIQHVTEIAGKIANGAYAARIAYRSDDDIGRLAGAINTLAEKLEKARDKSS